MKHTVFGKKNLSFTGSDGRTVEGVNLYVGYDDNSVEGMATDKLFVPASKLPKEKIIVGDDIDILFNRFGKVDKIIVG